MLTTMIRSMASWCAGELSHKDEMGIIVEFVYYLLCMYMFMLSCVIEFMSS